MSILQKHFPLVKEQLEFHQSQVERLGPNSFRGIKHNATAERLASLYADLQQANQELDEPKADPSVDRRERAPIQLSLTAEELDGLPQELIDQLTGADMTEFAIVNATEEAGGVITLDRLLIALYKKTGEIHKREQITSRLYRMAQKNLLFNVPGKKGMYSMDPLSADEFARLYGPAPRQRS